jgi:hypothetical protein
MMFPVCPRAAGCALAQCTIPQATWDRPVGHIAKRAADAGSQLCVCHRPVCAAVHQQSIQGAGRGGCAVAPPLLLQVRRVCHLGHGRCAAKDSQDREPRMTMTLVCVCVIIL